MGEEKKYSGTVWGLVLTDQVWQETKRVKSLKLISVSCHQQSFDIIRKWVQKFPEFQKCPITTFLLWFKVLRLGLCVSWYLGWGLEKLLAYLEQVFSVQTQTGVVSLLLCFLFCLCFCLSLLKFLSPFPPLLSHFLFSLCVLSSIIYVAQGTRHD